MVIPIIFCLFAICVVVLVATEKDMEIRCFLAAIATFFIVGLAILSFHTGKELGPGIQYIPAEYVAENETSTYFGTEDGNIFYVDRIPLIDRNVPYLLGMDTKGTPDVTDDIILTVWALCE